MQTFKNKEGTKWSKVFLKLNNSMSKCKNDYKILKEYLSKAEILKGQN